MPTVTVIQPKVADDAQHLLRVAAYCRVSSSSDDQLNSYNSQLTYYTRKFEDSETETLIDIYADEGITGTCEEKRTEFLRLIDDCRKGKIDRIYTKSISRFARNTRDCLKNIRELKSLGITIMFEKENIDTANINDELMLTIMGGLAQEESVSISKNMKWSIRRRMRNGGYINSHAPFGYYFQNKVLIINTEQAKIVRRIFSLYLSGLGFQSIANIINKECIDTSQYGQVWCPMTIKYILTNERYIGNALFQKSYRSDTPPFTKMKNNGELPKYLATSVNPPIIEQDVFETAQKMIFNRRKTYLNYNNLFSNKIYCGICGCTYKGRYSNGVPRWICRKHEQQIESCNNRILNNLEVESAFIGLFNKLFSEYSELLLPIQQSLQELEIKQAKGNKNIIELRRSILQLKEQLKVIATLNTKGFLNEAKFKEQSLEINNKIDKLNKDVLLLSQSDDTALKEIQMLIDYFEKREHIIVEFEPQAFEFLIDKIVVNDNILEFHIKGGLVFSEEI